MKTKIVFELPLSVGEAWKGTVDYSAKCDVSEGERIDPLVRCFADTEEKALRLAQAVRRMIMIGNAPAGLVGTPAANLPRFRYSASDERCLVLYAINVNVDDWLEVVGDPDNGGYEWVWRSKDGAVKKNSDCGYGSTGIAMRDGLIESCH